MIVINLKLFQTIYINSAMTIQCIVHLMINFSVTKTNYKLQFKIEIKKITYLIICPWLFQLQEHYHHDFVILNISIIIQFHLLPYQHQVEILQFIAIVIMVQYSVVNYYHLKIKIMMKQYLQIIILIIILYCLFYQNILTIL